MCKNSLECQTQTVREDLLILGSMTEFALFHAINALKEHDMEKSRSVIRGNRGIQRKRYEIEISVMATIAIQSPATYDLRFLASTLAVGSELKRIGDYARNISRVNLQLQEFGALHLLAKSQRMGATIVDVLHRAMTAFVLADVNAASRIILEDENCDAMYAQIYYELMDMVSKDARNIEFISQFLNIAHNLERAGDRVTNICERAIYVETGEMESDPSIFVGAGVV